MKKLNKSFVYGTGSVAMIAFAVVVIVLLNLISGVLADKFGWRIDVTETKLLDFSDEFVDIIESVDKPVEAYFLADEQEIEEIVQPDNYLIMAKQILEKMGSINPNISVIVSDPDKNPEFSNKLGTVNYADIVFKCGDKLSSMPSAEICSYDELGNQAIIAENKFASMIATVTREEAIKVGFVTGHNEMDTSFIKKAYDEEGIEYADFNILTDGISDEYDLIFIYAPQADYLVEEIEAIDAYLTSGHHMQIYIDKVSLCKNLVSYMSLLGIGYNDGYVQEKDMSHLISEYAVPDMNRHTITNTIANKLIVPYTVSLVPLWESKNGIDTLPLLATSEKATLYADPSAVGTYYLMAVSARVTESSLISNVVAGCSAYIYNEGVMDMNKPLLINSTLWLGKADSDMYIAPKAINNGTLEITEDACGAWQAIYAFLIPIIIIAIGFIVWFKRRYS